MAAELVKASATAHAADARMIQESRDALSRTIGQVDGIVKRGQAVDRQREQKVWTGFSGALIGMLIWSALPGAVAKALTASWHVPQWMAARTLAT